MCLYKSDFWMPLEVLPYLIVKLAIIIDCLLIDNFTSEFYLYSFFVMIFPQKVSIVFLLCLDMTLAFHLSPT